jgi:uncharacterized protein (DUF433 family)
MLTSPHLMRTMGLKFARSILDAEKLDAEQKLWRAVVVNALEDSMIIQSDRKASLLKIFAHNWILQGSKDFEVVCAWGNLDPDDIQECYVCALKNHELKFTHRQIMWFDYDKLYKKMLKADVKYKKQLRRDLTVFRNKVKDTPTTFLSTIFVSAFV